MGVYIKGMSKKDFEDIIKYARYGANNCMIGSGLEVIELPKAKDIYYTVKGHCEFKCSHCNATIGVVEGGTMDGAEFKYCPNCAAELESEP